MGALLGLIGTGISSFFGFKGKQAEVIESGLKTVQDVNSTAEARDLAAARVLVAEAQSESWLTRTWRPMFMVVFMVLLLSYWFGYVPPNLHGPMPPVIEEIFTIIKIGLGAYIPTRGIEKIVKDLGIGRTLRNYVDKKLT